MNLRYGRSRLSSYAQKSVELSHYATPDKIATAMASWAIPTKGDTLLDPCFGTSTLLIKGIERKLELGETLGAAVAGAFGVEISKEAIDAASMNLVTRFGRSAPALVQGDFLSLKPGKLKPIASILCNPPYRRHQDMKLDYKRRVSQELNAALGIEVSQRSDLYVYFILHAIRFLKSGGRMAFLTPTQYLENSYGEAIRKYLASKMRVHAILVFDERLKVFPNSMSTAALLLVENVKPTPRSTTRLVKLDMVPDSSDMLSLIAGRSHFPGTRSKSVRQSILLARDRWTASFETYAAPLPTRSMAEFGDVFTVTRGLATGANKVFVFTEKERVEHRIERKYVTRIVAKALYVPQLDFTRKDWRSLLKAGKKVWLLDCQPPLAGIESRNVRDYLKSVEVRGLNRGSILRHRSAWYAQERRRTPEILFTYMSNGNPRFVLNESGAVPLNVLHCVYLRPASRFDSTRLKAILAFLNSDFLVSRLRRFGRVYGHGMLKLEPRDFNNIPIIDLQASRDREVKALARYFENLAAATRRGSAQRERRKIDTYLRTKMPEFRFGSEEDARPGLR